MGARSKRQFVPAEFVVPSDLVTANFTLRMLSIDDVDKDFEAVTSSAERLSKVWPDSGWPAGLTFRQNLVDLGWHEKEFQNRTSFAYTVVAPDESQVLGCVYFYPTDKAGHDAEVFLWVRESELADDLDQDLFDVVQRWLASNWPFENPAYPGRTINWEQWDSQPVK
jgi:RimJ/RimL family protein N-acetyltransferase